MMAEGGTVDTRIRSVSTVSKLEAALTSDIKSIAIVIGFREPWFIYRILWKSLDKDYDERVSLNFGWQLTSNFLGSGSFGNVVVAVNVHDGRNAACKVVLLPRDQVGLDAKNEVQFLAGSEKILTNWKREVLVMDLLNGHPNIIELLGCGIINYRMYMFMELADQPLSKLVRPNEFGHWMRLPEVTLKKYFMQLVQGLRYIHMKGIAHLDIKPDNILMVKPDVQNDEFVLKWSDFGSSLVAFNKERGPLKSTVMKGTLTYMAPELIAAGLSKKSHYAFGADIWSLGITLTDMAQGVNPFPRPEGPFEGDIVQRRAKYRAMYKVLTKVSPFLEGIKDNYSKDLFELITQLLETNPEKRLTIDGILSHPWLSDQPGAISWVFT